MTRAAFKRNPAPDRRQPNSGNGGPEAPAQTSGRQCTERNYAEITDRYAAVTSLLATRASLLTSLLATRAPLHPGGLGLSI
jgi:hypothetical protein